MNEIREQIIISQARSLIFDSFSSNQEAFVIFDFSSFLKYFTYHLIYFFLLGPIFGLILLPIEGYNKLYIMGFFGLNFVSITQFLTFLCGGPNIILLIYFKYYYINKSTLFQENLLELFDNTELIFCCISIFIRSFIIGVRYGYTHREKISLRKKGKKVPIEVYRREYVISGWRNVSIETLDIEIKYSILRNEIETNFFFYNVMSVLSNEWTMRLSAENFIEKLASGKQESLKDLNAKMYEKPKVNYDYFKGKNIVQNLEFESISSKNKEIREKGDPSDLSQANNKASVKINFGFGISNTILNLEDKNNKNKNQLNHINGENKSLKKHIAFDHKKYSQILPLLQMIKKEKEKKFDIYKMISKEIKILNELKYIDYDNSNDLINPVFNQLINKEIIDIPNKLENNASNKTSFEDKNKFSLINNNESEKTNFQLGKRFNYSSDISKSDDQIKNKNENLLIKNRRRNTQSYKDLIKNFSRKMSHFKDSCKIIFKKVDETILQEEVELPSYLHKPDLELFLLQLPARILVREIIMFSKEKIKPYFMRFIALLIILHSLIPIIYRWANNQKVFGNNGLETYLILINLIISTLLYLISMLFVEIGGNDLERKRYFLEALSAILNPNKPRIEYIRFRFFPLINIFCKRNLKCWLNMRILAMDIGLRYFKRIELYASIFLFVYGLIVIILFLGLYDFLKFLKFHDYKLFYIIGFSESFISFLVLYRMMYLGVDVNGYFRRNIYQLNLIKSKINEVINNYSKWKKMTNYLDSYLEKTKDFYYYCILFHSIKSSQEIEDFKNNGFELPNPLKIIENGNDEFLEYLKDLCDSYSQIIEEIKILEEHSSIKLLGIKLNNELIMQFYFAILTLVLSLVQKYIDSGNKS